MDKGIYLSMTGAQATLLAQAANSHNLANASTVGFRADLTQSRAMPVFGDAMQTRVYALTERPGVDLRPGALETTGRPLDVAVNGEGWLAVQGADGTEAYTRAGSLQVDSLGGVLRTAAGHPVLGEEGPIALPPFQRLDLGADGTITMVPLGSEPANTVQVDRIKLVNPPPSTLFKGADGLIRTELDTAPADAAVNLVSGALEGSNVNTVSAVVEMASLARRFEMQVQMMRTVSDNEERTAELMRLG